MTSSRADWTLAGVKHRAQLGVKAPRVGAPYPRTHEIGGDEIRGELDTAIGAAQRRRQRLDGQRLGQAGDAFQQHVAAGQQADEQALEHRVLAYDDPLDLIQHLLEGLTGLVSLVGGGFDVGQRGPPGFVSR
jgi:hypothetical protein